MGHTLDEFIAFIDALKGLGLERAVRQAEAVVLADEEADRYGGGKGVGRHCVRCHKSFRESENGIEACVVTSPALFGFAVPLRNVSKHTTDAKQAEKTRGKVLLKTCAEEWCGRTTRGPAHADAKAILPASLVSSNVTALVPSTQSATPTASTPPMFSPNTLSTATSVDQTATKEARLTALAHRLK